MEATYGKSPLTMTQSGAHTVEQYFRELEDYYTKKLKTLESQVPSDQLQINKWKPLVDTLTQIVDHMNEAELDRLFDYMPKTRDDV